MLATAVRRVDGTARTSESAAELGRTLGLDLAVGLERAAAKGDAGEVVDLPVTDGAATCRRMLLVGVGDGSSTDLRRAGAALARQSAGAAAVATDTLDGLDAEAARAHVEGVLLAAYRFRAEGARRDARKAPVAAVHLHLPGRRIPAGVRPALARAEVTARAAHLARDLANTPSQLKDPAWLARQARDVGRRNGVDVTVRDEQALAAEGFGGILAVGSGSARPPGWSRCPTARAVRAGPGRTSS